jgi:hypothetical protein
MKFVRTRLHDSIDGAALEIAFAHVIGSDASLELRNGIQRNRRTTRGQAIGVQTEIVGYRNAVDGKAVETRILA